MKGGEGGGAGPGEDKGGLGGRAVEEEETVEEVDGTPGPCGEEGGLVVLWCREY